MSSFGDFPPKRKTVKNFKVYSEICNNLCDPKIELEGKELMLNFSAVCF